MATTHRFIFKKRGDVMGEGFPAGIDDAETGTCVAQKSRPDVTTLPPKQICPTDSATFCSSGN